MPNYAMDSFMCPGKGCGKALQCVDGKMYRCVNPLCPLFAIDQFPAGQYDASGRLKPEKQRLLSCEQALFWTR